MRTALAVSLVGGALLGGLRAAPLPQPPVPQDPAVQEPKPQPKPDPKPNRLAKETSPYLRQHQFNPVDWYPWGEEALARARREQKPIFLSIGYSACHWCHVMEHESFADPAIAVLLNEHFVCIKVDREERPDIDEIYMGALQAMGEPGGWPLSMWLLPDARPFYGGTYFPPEDGHGRPGFRRVLEHLAKAWRERPDELRKPAAELAAHLAKVLAPELPAGEVGPALLGKVLAQSQERFDADGGGFAYPPQFAPKFPHACELQALLRLPDAAARTMVVASLRGMRRGGIYDQLAGGFHRYSTDRQWLVPHFEKMLYDNALLVTCYLEAHLATGDADFARVAAETLDYLLRDLQLPDGGFCSSTDADSEGQEGKFFVWSAAEFDRVLGARSALARRHYGVTDAGNWEHQNVLTFAAAEAEVAAATGQPLAQATAELAAARAALLAARQQRVAPGRDDKVLCAWNGLAIAALAQGYQVLGEPRYLQGAERAAAFALRELVRDGRCWRSWHSGTARHPGYLEDQAMLAHGLLRLFEASGEPRWLLAARELLQVLVARFAAADGGFYFTSDDHEALLARTKTAAETALPSGQAMAAQALLRAGLLLGDRALYDRGLAVLRANQQLLQEAPAAVPSLVLALQFHLADPQEVVVAGPPDDPRTRALLQAAWRGFPAARVVALVHDGNRAALAKLSPVFDGKTPRDGVPAAYVCRRGVCAAPVTDPAALGGGK